MEEALKSSYNLEFPGIRQQVKERKLEDRLIDRLRDFSARPCPLRVEFHRAIEPRNSAEADLRLSLRIRPVSKPIYAALVRGLFSS